MDEQKEKSRRASHATNVQLASLFSDADAASAAAMMPTPYFFPSWEILVAPDAGLTD